MPSQDQLTAELKTLRLTGLAKMEKLDLPALLGAARLATADRDSADGVVIEATLRRAVERFGGDSYGDAAAVLFGLEQGTRTASSARRRTFAAEHLEKSFETFRKSYEPTMLAQVATQILMLCSEQHTRSAREQLERHDPVESAMAVEWLRRFEAYYRIWTPIYALAADLTAYRMTLIEAQRPYDRRHGTYAPDDQGYEQETQAEGYARFALYHYSLFEWERKRFIVGAGGLWLLSDGQAENAVRDAVNQISWHVTPYNERDQSSLRSLIAETPDQEMHGFLERLTASEPGRATEQEWQDWAANCSCSWAIGSTNDEEYFPTSAHHSGIQESCELHQLIAACGTYCDLIDQDWRQVADWYRLGENPERGQSAEQLYRNWRAHQTPDFR